ncbi:putative asparagine synthase [Chondrocystis sp. NIES-4102]|nr:putative asparagine synthase [Chondrocystis sp. NIES-4102]
MSAIFGIYYLDQRLTQPKDIQKMSNILSHTGSDAANIWCDRHVALGHRMLWTTPESMFEQLPSTTIDGNLTITADARIDNRQELISHLKLLNSADIITDSQIILAAYQQWGSACVQHLIGDFAFAIWNCREHKLFCARDHYGVKPFYYYHAPGKTLVFASQIKALLCLSEIPNIPNDLTIAYYLQGGFQSQINTFYQDIFKLPPASLLEIQNNHVSVSKYWTPDINKTLKLDSDQEYAEAYLEVFTQAVNCRLRSNFAIGSTLSGGLDSSSIVCVARELLLQQQRPKLKTFSAIFNDATESDESPYIQSVVQQGNIEPYYVAADRYSPLTDWEKMLWHLDKPFGSNLYLHWNLYKEAQKQGTKIFLDGFFGDDAVFHGWEYLIDLATTFSWWKLSKELKAISRVQGYKYGKNFRKYLKNYSLPVARRYVRDRFIPLPLLQIWRKRNIKKPQLLPKAIIAQELIARTNFQDLLTQELHQQQQYIEHISTAKESHYYALLSRGITIGLEEDHAAATAFGIEPWFPFTDIRLTDFCLSIPLQQKLSQGFTRNIVRRALSGYLPDKIRLRHDKGNLSAGFHYGLINFERDIFDNTVAECSSLIEPYIDLKAFKQQYQQYISNPGGNNIPSVLLAVELALWLKQQHD